MLRPQLSWNCDEKGRVVADHLRMERTSYMADYLAPLADAESSDRLLTGCSDRAPLRDTMLVVISPAIR